MITMRIGKSDIPLLFRSFKDKKIRITSLFNTGLTSFHLSLLNISEYLIILYYMTYTYLTFITLKKQRIFCAILAFNKYYFK